MLKLHVIGSGSKGNAALIEDAATGNVLAVDCGLCARDYLAGLSAAGVDPAQISGLLITHEHTDHTKGLGVVLRALRKKGAQVPVYVDEPAARNSRDVMALVGDFSFRRLEQGKRQNINGIDVLPFATSHDAASSCGFRFEATGDALGYLTDSGIVTPQAHDALQQVRILALESNHDPEMLRVGPYPYPLKRRVGDINGHLSNQQAADELRELMWSGLEQVVAMHISQNNNTYDLPEAVLREALGDHAAHVQSAHQSRMISVC